MKTAKLLTTATAALGLAAGIAAAQNVDVDERIYMTDESGQLYEVTLVKIDEEDMAEHSEDAASAGGEPTERDEALGADPESTEGRDRLVLTENYVTERDQEQTTGDVREVESFEGENGEVETDAARP